MRRRLVIVDDDGGRWGTPEGSPDLSGYDVRFVSSSSSCLRALSQSATHLVLLSGFLKHEDSMVLLERIREEHPEIPVIVFTHDRSFVAEIQAFLLGAVDFVETGGAPEELRIRIETALLPDPMPMGFTASGGAAL